MMLIIYVSYSTDTVPLSYHVVSRYHIHDKLVLIAGATLLNSFNLHWLIIFRLTNSKVRNTVPPFRHIGCRLRKTVHVPNF